MILQLLAKNLVVSGWWGIIGNSHENGVKTYLDLRENGLVSSVIAGLLGSLRLHKLALKISITHLEIEFDASILV